MAGAKNLKKTTIVNGNSTVVPGYETAMCIIFGLMSFFSMQALLIAASECVPCSPHVILHTLTFDCAAAAKESWVTL